MRKIVIIFVMLLILAACSKNINNENRGNKMKGRVLTKETKEFMIHSYIGYSGDVSNVLEFDEEIIILDPQPTYSATKELKDYVLGLSKAVKLIVISSHGIGDNTLLFPEAKVVASREMQEFMNGPAVNGFIEAFTQRFGDDMIKDVIDIDSFYTDNRLLDNQVDIVTHPNDYPPCSDIYFSNDSVIFTHLAAENTHLLMSNPQDLDDLVKFWHDAQEADVVMSSHLQAIGKEGIAFTLKYVISAKEVFESVKTKEEYMSQMKEKYPNAGLDFFNAMTADNFFK
jgi:hypothetical protein